MKHLVEATVSRMELRDRFDAVPPPRMAERLELREVPNISLERYRDLYAAVGKPHHWTSRLLPDRALAAEIHSAGMSVHVLEADGRQAGWFELEGGRRRGCVRIVHFGIMPRFRGRGLARYLLSEAIQACRAASAETVTLETNTLDHPAAMKLYLEAGFVCVGKRLVVTPALET